MLRRATRLVPRLGAAAAASAAAYNLSTALSESAPPELGAELAALSTDGEVVENWSGTHSASPSAYFQPETPAAVQRVVDLMGAARRRLRVVGSALSPNGMGLSDDGMLNMAFCAGVVSVDAERRQVTVQAGARVKEVVEALRPHGLTLQNYASIAEQQIGGFVQVGAHGTGAAVPPVDEQVVRLRLHTPALGALELSEASNPRLFRLAKVGLGALGVVSEVTLQCVPAHKLLQTTFVETRAGVQKRHARAAPAQAHAVHVDPAHGHRRRRHARRRARRDGAAAAARRGGGDEGVARAAPREGAGAPPPPTRRR